MPVRGRGSSRSRGRGRGRGRGRARETKESSPDKCSDRSFSPVREDIAAVTEPPKKMRCDFCKRNNHVTEDCRDLKKVKEKKADKCNDCGYTNHSTVQCRATKAMKERYQKSLKMTQDSNKEDQKESSTNWTPKSKAKNGKSERVQCFICKKFHLGNCKACINCKNVKCSCKKRPATEEINGQWASKVQKINRYNDFNAEDYALEQAAKVMMGEIPALYNPQSAPIQNIPAAPIQSLPPAPVPMSVQAPMEAWTPLSTPSTQQNQFKNFAQKQPNATVTSFVKNDPPPNFPKRKPFSIDLNSLSLSIDRADAQVKNILDQAEENSKTPVEKSEFKNELIFEYRKLVTLAISFKKENNELRKQLSEKQTIIEKILK